MQNYPWLCIFVKMYLIILIPPSSSMNFFKSSEPVLRRKQHELDVQDLRGIWRIHWKIGNFTLWNAIYTRIDQVFLLWGVLTAAIFLTAQFSPFDWGVQAVFWSILTVIGTVGMLALSWSWVVAERAVWLVVCWMALMGIGLFLTDYSIFYGWGEVMLNLGPLWLGLTAIGYLITGFGLRSRALAYAGIFHLLSGLVLLSVSDWQFLSTGMVMAGSLLLLGESQWDMRSPIDYNLSEVEKEFNRLQHQVRQTALQRNH